ncbi:undecaprenyl-phosphate glucose phosphotransferase [Xylophilus sp. GOD-11R]|uniref:undecaprenyl-phosphate glucose phosphotransferase n=1 Tax=Xylophilus sp. GOD-11R TaxID=3089814 RepID=UPI00298CE45E|nr:undecaprenyl-phosphate glucose phosphotransferase [Xylophilus sp. GOD-11R]WPB57923.1 undecaprenyl-phosphate glucose phosphotransferase [Xylophilus sp. GOD-11R]
MIESILEPCVLIGSLWILAAHALGEVTAPYMVLSLIIFALTFPGLSRSQLPIWQLAARVMVSWVWIAALLLMGGYATRALPLFDTGVLANWLWVAPSALILALLLLKKLAPWITALQGAPQKVVIVGVNAQGLALAERINHASLSRLSFSGFFDDRDFVRLPAEASQFRLGIVDDLPAYVRENDVAVIFLSLPMAAEPRVLEILDALKDTTASIYFVPDMFVTDLIQARASNVEGIPVIAVCETPFHGMMGVIKRSSDMVLALFILCLIAPLMIGLSIAIKLTSPGPIIFRQRRYGLDGKQITVYKFRSMHVGEDDEAVRQAKRNDSRITPLGAFMRKTSLDELPQFINVLQWRMSIVGPRPHAVSHNELYRKLIKGYMVRHKVKPGITGWAQVNGFRGETETLDKMQSRIEFDLDYLRNWSLRLDLSIILQTVRLVFKDHRAY